MSKIHYFQRYSSVENTVTNNTLQLIARIYNFSSVKASILLSDLTEESIEIGIEINQQERGINSIPDGSILQRSFKVLIESKVDSDVNINQLIKHAGGFNDESQKILLLLTKQRIDSNEEKNIQNKINHKYDSVLFKNITYEIICNVIEGLFQDYEYEMNDLVNDYIEYCNDINLFDQSRFLMRVPPCGQSIEINIKHGIYFQPSDRGYSNHKYLGVYAQKSIQAIWEIKCTYDVIYNEKLKKNLVSGIETNEFDEHIIEIIKDAKIQCGYDVSSKHRFFCGNPILTNYKKVSRGGIQGARIINLKNIIGELESVEDIALKLKSETWK